MLTKSKEKEYKGRTKMATKSNNEGKRPSSKKMSAKQRAKKKRNRTILFIVEILILIIMLGVLYFVIKGEKSTKISIKEEDIIINEQVAESETMKGYRNIALFGVDARNGALGKGTRSDSILIASINMDTNDVKLLSVYRDTYMNLGNDTYNKCNASYAKGGPEQAMNMLNMNMDMNITDYVTVGFEGLIEVIDALDGIEVDVDSSEISHLNNYQITMAEDLGRKYNSVTSTGLQVLDGMQATAYCRIRYTKGDDFKRAERQREVIMAIVEKAKKANVGTLNKIIDGVMENVSTSLDIDEILGVLGEATKYNIVANGGFPFEEDRTTGNIGSKGSCVVPVTLEQNVISLHKFFFEAEEYTPTAAVKGYSDKIVGDTSSYVGK